jgi:hypothetical protein
MSCFKKVVLLACYDLTCTYVSAAKPIQHARSLTCTVPVQNPGLERVALKIAKGMEELRPAVLVSLYHCKLSRIRRSAMKITR